MRMGNEKFYADIMSIHHEVTGSAILVVIKQPDRSSKEILIDCGLFQEEKYTELNKILPFKPSNLDHVIVTHNHVDHVGRLPLLFKGYYGGQIHMSEPTTELIRLALEDSYKVIKSKAKLTHQAPLYSNIDVEGVLRLVKGHPYNETFELDENIKLTFFKNGHLPGAVVGLLQISCCLQDRKYDDINILFTGDYKNSNMFFEVPQLPEWVIDLPLTIIQECTYGNMDSSKISYCFESNLKNAIWLGKSVVIPVFSLGRAQEIMYLLKKFQDSGMLSEDIPIYFDGKLGIRYTLLYTKNLLGLDLIDFLPQNFQYVTNSEQRFQIIEDLAPKIILTTSGMGSYGPAQTYLPAFLKRKNALIHFTGYVAEGTLGRRLYDCPKSEIVSVAGLEVKKLADVKFTSEFSAHAKSDELLDFLKTFSNPKLILINHGSEEAQVAYSRLVINDLNPKDLGILDGQYVFRINPYGLVKTFSTKFR